MRKRIPTEEKRSNIIGIKVKTETLKKLKYISKRECKPVSTYIDSILVKQIEEYFSIAHINWDKLTENEKEGRE